MTIAVGDRIPDVKLYRMGAEGPEPFRSAELFAGKKVALFGLPGAFTPTCSAKHLPGFRDNAEALAEKGIQSIACVSVNDAFVMDAWGRDQKVGDRVQMIADGSAVLATALGLDMDQTDIGRGIRCQRFSAVVDDGVVTALYIEPQGAYRISSAEYMLDHL